MKQAEPVKSVMGREIDWFGYGRDRWWTLVNVVVNFQVPKNSGNLACFLPGRAKHLSAPLYISLGWEFKGIDETFAFPIWIMCLLQNLRFPFRSSSYAQWGEECWQFLKLNDSREFLLLYVYRARNKITQLSIPTHAQLQRHRLKFIK